jgi:uncharacterized protein YjbJ (UPF0337 family)
MIHAAHATPRNARTEPRGASRTGDGRRWPAVVFPPTIEERVMNKDQMKGRMKEAAGKVEQKAGKATGSIKTQAKGLGKEAAGKVQKNVGDARNDVENQRDEP